MKKFLIVAAIATTLGTGGYFGIQASGHIPQNRSSELILANIEALSYDPEQVIKACEIHCWTRIGYICVLNTSSGVDLECYNSVPWNYTD